MGKRKSTRLGKLTPRGKEILAYVFNAIAFHSHGDKCDVETMAAEFKLKPGTLRRTLTKMQEAGYITVEGSGEYVYPTVPAIMHQQPDLHLAAAQNLLKRVHREG